MCVGVQTQPMVDCEELVIQQPLVHHFWFGISVLARSNLEPAFCSLTTSGSFLFLLVCLLQRGFNSTHPINQFRLLSLTSLPELVPFCAEVSILSLVKTTSYLFKVWLQ